MKCNRKVEKINKKSFKKLSKFHYKVKITKFQLKKVGVTKKLTKKVKKVIKKIRLNRCNRKKYEPYCGDGVTYNNICTAKASKSKSISKGVCPKQCN